jgi:5S rRNA maturation endonuclease (ribonuclease M5)
MPNLSRNIPLSADMERADRLREVLERLKDVNKKVPIIVEGRKDAEALKGLGIEGKIIALHSGKSIYDFCEDIAAGNFQRVILLLDWDERGESLHKTLCKLLNGIWEEFSGFREIIKILCQKDIKDIEGMPKLLRRLNTDETNRQ